MAFVGLRKPIIAEMTADKTYGEPFAFGKAVGLQVTPSYAEGSLNADDEQVLFGKLNAAFSVRLKRVFRST